MEFSKNKPNIVHLDINSCFATIEQQANPLLRGKPLAVVAYDSPHSCILASSIEAKKLGIKTGMSLIDGKKIFPKLIHLLPDPPKYRNVHKKIKRILNDYSSEVNPKSIDEFSFKLSLPKSPKIQSKEIKKRIRREVGEHISVSVGISTNKYLAKIASNLQKPDGLSVIDKTNFLKVFEKLSLVDLTGIKQANKKRLNSVGIFSVSDFYNSPIWKLRIAFGGITGFYWFLRLHGFEIDEFESQRKTFGNSFAPPKNLAPEKEKILCKLCQKTGFRLREAGYGAYGIHLSILFRDGSNWHKGEKTKEMIFTSERIYKEARKLLKKCPLDSVPRIIAVSVFNLVNKNNLQLNFFEDILKKEKLSESIDLINRKWGDFTLHPARMMNMEEIIQDRIAFGR